MSFSRVRELRSEFRTQISLSLALISLCVVLGYLWDLAPLFVRSSFFVTYMMVVYTREIVPRYRVFNTARRSEQVTLRLLFSSLVARQTQNRSIMSPYSSCSLSRFILCNYFNLFVILVVIVSLYIDVQVFCSCSRGWNFYLFLCRTSRVLRVTSFFSRRSERVLLRTMSLWRLRDLARLLTFGFG